MQKLAVSIFGVWFSLAGVCTAGSGPVLVELFTSQGCSSCPPADEFLGKLAARDDVVALSLHVDYWDYIGWKDSFANPKFSKRQHAYAYAAGKKMVYTPQMVVAGRDHVIGTKFSKIGSLIKKRNAENSTVSLLIERRGNKLIIQASVKNKTPDMVVQLVRYSAGQRVAIKRGENAGRKITYHNVVTSWSVLKQWSGNKPLSMAADVSGSDPIVVIVQTAGHGPVLATARLR